MMIELRDNGGYLEGSCLCGRMAVLLDGGGGGFEVTPKSGRQGLRLLIGHVSACKGARRLDDALAKARLVAERYPTIP